jgi:uncharacterized protein
VKLSLREIPQGHSVIDREEPADLLDLEEWFTPLGDVRAHLDADRRGEAVTFRGTAAVEGVFPCARCLKEVRLPLEAELIVLADRRGADAPRDERALEEEGEVLYHEGLEIDLGPSLREALILEVPQVVLCRPDCRGLCPRCGQDWNQGECSCSFRDSDPRWTVLRELATRDPETE